MITTAYGSFYNVTSRTAPAAVVVDYISGADTDWYDQMEASGALDAITADYADAIDKALPDNIWLSGDQFYGPSSEDENYDDSITLDDLRDAVDGIDLAEIIQRHADAAVEAVMQNITDAEAERAAATQQLAAAKQALAENVRAALKLEVQATTVADHLGVTRARVYQIRDGRRR